MNNDSSQNRAISFNTLSAILLNYSFNIEVKLGTLDKISHRNLRKVWIVVSGEQIVILSWPQQNLWHLSVRLFFKQQVVIPYLSQFGKSEL